MIAAQDFVVFLFLPNDDRAEKAVALDRLLQRFVLPFRKILRIAPKGNEPLYRNGDVADLGGFQAESVSDK